MSDRGAALALAAGLFVLYNANGREIGNYDSQPTKFAAREVLVRGTLALNHVVGATPQLAERPAFVLARDGAYRSAYSPVPAVAAAAIAWPFWKLGLLDVRAPLGPNYIAALAASVLTTGAAVLAFFTARRYMPTGRAAILTIALGAGTGYWSTVSQTLWQHETAIAGLALAVLTMTAPAMRLPHLVFAGLGLGIAGAARAQLAPAVAVLLVGLFWRNGWRRAAIPVAIAAAFAAAVIAMNVRWFGSPLGALAELEALHPRVHATERSFDPSIAGFAGLLVSPNRGLFVFSPIVLAAFAGLVPAFDRRRFNGPAYSALRWCGLAAVAEYALYASYSVWWAGHTFGPRYMLDVLPLLVPLAAGGIGAAPLPRPAIVLGAAALAWSVLVAGTGAFVFPNERWNIDPRDVDRHHARLWDWSDLQVVRCWTRGPSPQNFSLFEFD
jgi:hypothetical protein